MSSRNQMKREKIGLLMKMRDPELDYKADEGDDDVDHEYVYDYRYDVERSIQGKHKHRLDYIAEGFIQKAKCGRCGLLIAEQEGCYGCSGCSYAAHERCGRLPRTILGHPCHPQSDRYEHQIKLKYKPNRDDNAIIIQSRECYYCRKGIVGPDPFYTCDSCSIWTRHPFRMHTSCALIPLPAILPRRLEYYMCHQNLMKLAGDEGRPARGVCFSCQSPWSGPAYCCAASPRCHNFFHKSCAEIPRTASHPGHPEHELEVAIGRPESCAACERTNCRHVYYCRRKTEEESSNKCLEFAVGAECIFFEETRLPRLFTSHEHELCLVKDERPSLFQCDACRKSHDASVPDELHRTRNFWFRCRDCVFNLHFLCGPLPSVVKFDCHIHPLLLDLLVENDYGEYYCDVCEEQRDPRFRVYHCSPCKYTAHLHCLQSEIMKLIKEKRSSDVKFMMLGESSCNLKGQENSGHGDEADATDENFEKIIDSLTEEDRAKLSNTYSSREKILLNQNVELMSFFDGDKESKTKDVDRAEKLFQLGSSNFSQLCLDLSYFKPRKPFELDRKYTKMKTVDVGGYMVPWALASNLEMLLHKYGDLAGDSSLTPQMKSFTATLLCEIVNKRRNTLAVDMSVDDLKHWYFTLNGVRKIAGYKMTELDCFEESVITTFLGFEALRFKKDANETIDLNIVKLETELEKWKERRERLKKFECITSDFMKECLRKASESTWKTVDTLF